MRFKFRAWDKERNEMRSVKLMDWSDWWVSTGSTWEREKPLDYGERNSFNNEQTDRHILMQYTGLKDKNDKEIYEGDILKVPDLYETPENTSTTYTNWVVTFEYGSFRLGNQPMHEDYEYISEECEVIGNVCENPEIETGD